ncbi:hypothetical protein [Neobacillus sp. LXY-1]|uniref:hypothetical protein n=1 Tax=Neobacillus sp. LXY-1 TaxID=3379133 RepID=UPI003EE202EE
MKKINKGVIPVVLVALVSIVLIGLFYYYDFAHLQPTPGKIAGKKPERPQGAELFTLFGNGAILAGALSFSWYLLKKKLKSPFKIVKIVAKKAFSFHTYIGWAALALVAVHGGYFLITDFKNTNNLTGAAAFLLLLSLAIYGYVLQRKKKKSIRSAHFILSILWIGALLVHGGGFVIAFGVGLAGLFILVTIFEKKLKKPNKMKKPIVS